jgi:hypothetical protein
MGAVMSAWGAAFGAAWGNSWGQTKSTPVYQVYGFAPDLRSIRYRKIDLKKYLKQEEEKPLDDAPLQTVVKKAKRQSEQRYPLYFPVEYRAAPSNKHQIDDDARWKKMLIAADAAYRLHKQKQEEEDIAFVMSFLASM